MHNSLYGDEPVDLSWNSRPAFWELLMSWKNPPVDFGFKVLKDADQLIPYYRGGMLRSSCCDSCDQGQALEIGA